MLVLTRKKSEMIQIGDRIVIKIIHTGKYTVKIGIEAPTEVRVLRAELCGAPAPDHPLAGFLRERSAIRTGLPATASSLTSTATAAMSSS